MAKEKVLRKLNQVTIKANLNFNVNLFKTWMRKKFQDDNKLFEKDGKMCLPKFSGAHIAITAMNEKLCYLILEKAITRVTKDRTGLYVIHFRDISDVVQVDTELRRDLFHFMDSFDPTLNYRAQYCIEELCVKKYIDDMFGKSIDINNEAFNLLIYLLHKASIRVLDTAFIMILFAKKKSLSPNAILSGVSAHFTGTNEHLLKLRIDEAVKASGKDLDDKEGEKETVPEEEGEKHEPIPEEEEPVVVEEQLIEQPDTVTKTEKKRGRGRKNE